MSSSDSGRHPYRAPALSPCSENPRGHGLSLGTPVSDRPPLTGPTKGRAIAWDGHSRGPVPAL